MKPTTWSEMQHPTPEQWLTWLLDNDPADQLVIATRVLESAEQGWSCRIMAHESIQRELAASQAQFGRQVAKARRYRLAWLSARRYRRRVRDLAAEYLSDRAVTR